jgi:MFS family permease
VLSIGAGFAIMRWHRVHKESPLGRERLPTAMRVGLQYVRQSARLRGIMLRISLYFFHSTALLALLPLIARALPGGGAGTFTVLLSAMGTGAICTVLLMPRLRSLLPMPRMIFIGVLLQAGAAATAAWAPSLWVAIPAMFVAGTGWISVANSLTVQAQMALPDWVRARGMSMLQMAIMGSAAAGAALWGQVANWTGVHTAVGAAAASSVVLMTLVQWLRPESNAQDDLRPVQVVQVPELPARPAAGRVLTRVEYIIDPAHADDFLALMEDSRRSRLQQGALSWKLLHDVADAARYVEQIEDESWTEHLRRFDRTTASDAQLRERRLACHVGELPPRVSRYLIEQE